MEEEILEIQEDLVEEEKEEQKKELKKGKKFYDKTIYLLAFILIFILIIPIIYLIFLNDEDEDIKINTPTIDKKLIKAKPREKYIKTMLQKANILYKNSEKEEALKIFEFISYYSKSISNYNLGVTLLKDKKYKEALKTFKQNIQDGTNICINAINAAVSSLYLKDEESFLYYIKLANSYLIQESNSPLYPYYYTLINYYQGNYLEALASIKNNKPSYYKDNIFSLASNINILFNNNYDAVNFLEKNLKDYELLKLGKLYARIGELDLAKKYINKSIKKGLNLKDAQMSLAIINLKSGDIGKATNIIKKLYDEEGAKISNLYPIKIHLKESLFDLKIAQEEFKRSIKLEEKLRIKILFYFAPYKIFDNKKAFNYIKKGNLNIFLKDLKTANNILKKGVEDSKINISIIKSIKLILKNKIHKANKIMLDIVKKNPRESIIRYNLALSYAQLGDFQNAYKNFKRAYHLNEKNYLAGIFTLFTAKIIKEDLKKFTSILQENLNFEEDNLDIKFYKTAIAYLKNNISATIAWLNIEKKSNILHLAFDNMIANQIDNEKIAKQTANELSKISPKDILPHILYIYSHYKDLNMEEFSFKTIEYLNKQNISLERIYNTQKISQELFIRYNHIIGNLYSLRDKLHKKLETSPNIGRNFINTLALTNIYTQNFEESFALYNQLIDKYKQRDPDTLFNAAIAATGAGKYANAIALLELANISDRTHNESNLALGLLYMQINNYAGALPHLAKFDENNFNSKFFDFKLKE